MLPWLSSQKSFKGEGDTVSSGQWVDCSKAAYRISENLGERYKGSDQGSGRVWRQVLRLGKAQVRCGSNKGRGLPHTELVQEKPLRQVDPRGRDMKELNKEEIYYGVEWGVMNDSISVVCIGWGFFLFFLFLLLLLLLLR
jgi:hypothetical protein